MPACLKRSDAAFSSYLETTFCTTRILANIFVRSKSVTKMTVITMFHSTRGIPKTNKDGKRIMSVTGVIGLDNPKHANNIQPHTILKRTEYCPIIGSFMMKKDSKITMSERINTLGCTSVCFPSRVKHSL